jgi:hypothetical protein
MGREKNVCAYCHNEILDDISQATSNMANCHINERGQIEKCYTKRKLPLSLIFGKKNYKGIKAWWNSPMIYYSEVFGYSNWRDIFKEDTECKK